MKKFLTLLAIIIALWVYMGRGGTDHTLQGTLGEFKDKIQQLSKDPDLQNTLESVSFELKSLAAKLGNNSKGGTDNSELVPTAEKPKLTTPAQHVFSIYNLELGDSRANAEKQLGAPKRSSINEYGLKWYSYHKNYQNFVMAAYDKDNRIAALYTDQDLISSSKGIKLGTQQSAAEKALGTPLTKIQKGFAFYLLPKDKEYDMYLLDDSYATIFYDKHQNNTVTALQLIRKDIEREKKDYYTKPSKSLIQGFEAQLFDLTNASRVVHGLRPLTWDERIKGTAEKHSDDMAVHNFFDHTNLKGQSPFDRMHNDHIYFSVAGENIAYGQMSSIFAHEGLMNSLGHRENILKPDFERLGVGVAFNSQSQPYYTENFYTK
ncbi:CAP domain-containing protein [Peribacillus kribbensis]|uniref:CAP domain-containing protein n=1 Tax=Peribacillus kribbensis TaxID=356658 RepID=UPI0003F99F31|nr:CAP domain-containing protein [Peribacillus kribbensis]